LPPLKSGKKTKFTKYPLSKWRGYVLKTLVVGKYVAGEHYSTFKIGSWICHNCCYIKFSLTAQP
jgi:hypothetical protein